MSTYLDYPRARYPQITPDEQLNNTLSVREGRLHFRDRDRSALTRAYGSPLELVYTPLITERIERLTLPETEPRNELYLGFFGTGAYQELLSGVRGVHHCLLPEAKAKALIVARDSHGGQLAHRVAHGQSSAARIAALGYDRYLGSAHLGIERDRDRASDPVLSMFTPSPQHGENHRQAGRYNGARAAREAAPRCSKRREPRNEPADA